MSCCNALHVPLMITTLGKKAVAILGIKLDIVLLVGLCEDVMHSIFC